MFRIFVLLVFSQTSLALNTCPPDENGIIRVQDKPCPNISPLPEQIIPIEQSQQPDEIVTSSQAPITEYRQPKVRQDYRPKDSESKRRLNGPSKALTINDARRIAGDANLSDDELIAIARKAGFEFDPIEPTNSETIDALLNNPRTLFGKFIVQPLGGVALAYGLVWLVMRPKNARKMNNSLLWHTRGVVTTILGSAIFRIIAMVTFAGRSAFEPIVEGGGGAGFYMLIVPALVATGYISWLKKNMLDLSDPTPDPTDLKHQFYLASKIASLFDRFIIQTGANSFLSSTTAVALSKDTDVFLSQLSREKLIGHELIGYVKISQLKSYNDVREMMLNEPESGLLTVYIDNLAQEALRELISQARSA